MGIRDAANLGWRLSLVLKGFSKEELLDGYSPERRAPCKFLIVGLCIYVPRLAFAEHDCRILRYKLGRLSVFPLMKRRTVCMQSLERKVGAGHHARLEGLHQPIIIHIVQMPSK